MFDFILVKTENVLNESYELIANNRKYNFFLTKINGNLDSVLCNIKNGNEFVGFINYQHNEKIVDIHYEEDIESHATIFEEFLNFVK